MIGKVFKYKLYGSKSIVLKSSLSSKYLQCCMFHCSWLTSSFTELRICSVLHNHLSFFLLMLDFSQLNYENYLHNNSKNLLFLNTKDECALTSGYLPLLVAACIQGTSVSFEHVVHVKFGVILADGDIYVQFHNPCTILSISNERLR